jgi:hypothetical protein
MFKIDEDLSINVTRGDAGTITLTAQSENGNHIFRNGDLVRLKVFEKKACENVVLQTDVHVTTDTEAVLIHLTGHNTTIGEEISKPVDYWYEVELNPLTNPQTIIGYDEDGAKIFRLYPEGGNLD